MKIILIIENAISSGGGFNQAVNAILQMQKICEGRFELEVFSTQTDNIAYLKSLGITSFVFNFSLFDKFLSKFSTNALWQWIQNRIRVLGSFEKKLIGRDCDLVYFVTPSIFSLSLQQLNYIITVWDNCHRDMPEFPEVRRFNQFHARERNYKNILSPAFLVVVDSNSLAGFLNSRYGIDVSRQLIMPFLPSPFLDNQQRNNSIKKISKYKLKGGYLFYPAQFWAHKNHIRVLQAINLLRQNGRKYNVVFVGGDQGNRSHIENFVERYKLQEQVHILGFVSNDEMHALYEECLAVVMPTYFGPTNIPPLEAWLLGKPLIYSDYFSEQVKGAAILVDPDNELELAEAITSCENQEQCKKLIAAGRARLQELEQERKCSESELLKRLIQFEKRLSCWHEKATDRKTVKVK